MKLSELLKAIYKTQNIEVFNYKDETLLYQGLSKNLKDKNILKRKVKNIFTLACETDTDDESYIIINLLLKGEKEK